MEWVNLDLRQAPAHPTHSQGEQKQNNPGWRFYGLSAQPVPRSGHHPKDQICIFCLKAAFPFQDVCPYPVSLSLPGEPSCWCSLPMHLSLNPSCPTYSTGVCISICPNFWGCHQSISSAVTYYRSATASAQGPASNNPAERQEGNMKDQYPTKIKHKKVGKRAGSEGKC